MKVETLQTTSVADLLGAMPEAPPEGERSFQAALDEVRREESAAEVARPREERVRKDRPERGESSESSEPSVSVDVSEPSVTALADSDLVLEGPTDEIVAEAPVFSPEALLTTDEADASPVVSESTGESLPFVPETENAVMPILTEGTELVTAEETLAETVEVMAEMPIPVTESRATVPTSPVMDAAAEVPGLERPSVREATPSTSPEAGGEPGTGAGVPDTAPSLGGGAGDGREGGGTPGDGKQSGNSFFMLEGSAESAVAKAGESLPQTEAQSVSRATSQTVAPVLEQTTSAPSTARTDGIASPVSIQPGSATESLARVEASLRVDPSDSPDLARRLQRLVRRAVRLGDGQMRIQLDPPSLGRVDIDVKIQRDQLNVQIQVDNESVREVLMKHLQELEQALQSFGYEDGEVSVDLRDSQDSDPEGSGSTDKASGSDPEDLEGDSHRELVDTTRGGVVDLKG